MPACDWFGGRPRAETNFGGSAGCLAGPALMPDELSRLHEIVHQRLIYNARNLHGERASDLVANVPLAQYHTVCDRLNHSKMLTKTGRILRDSDIREIKQMSIFDEFRRAFGSVRLSDEDNIGFEQICMRVARPQRTEDVGFLHCDSWFWRHHEWPLPEGLNRTKVWIGLDVQPELNGLVLCPRSHLKNYDFKVSNLGYKIKFDPDFDTSELTYETFPGRSGQAVVFNYGTLHVGKLNQAAQSRTSIEFTLLY